MVIPVIVGFVAAQVASIVARSGVKDELTVSDDPTGGLCCDNEKANVSTGAVATVAILDNDVLAPLPSM